MADILALSLSRLLLLAGGYNVSVMGWTNVEDALLNYERFDLAESFGSGD